MQNRPASEEFKKKSSWNAILQTDSQGASVLSVSKRGKGSIENNFLV
jgi:hypothetical protein